MSNRKQRDQNRKNAYELKARFGAKPACPNCGKPGKHYVPPSFGDNGHFTCQQSGSDADV